MSQPVVHVEIVGRAPDALRAFYAALFGWAFAVGDPATPTVSDRGAYGFVDGAPSDGVHGGVGGGPGHAPAVRFYVSVSDVGAALQRAEELGGRRLMGPEGGGQAPVVGWLADPEGNVVGVAGPA